MTLLEIAASMENAENAFPTAAWKTQRTRFPQFPQAICPCIYAFGINSQQPNSQDLDLGTWKGVQPIVQLVDLTFQDADDLEQVQDGFGNGNLIVAIGMRSENTSGQFGHVGAGAGNHAPERTRVRREPAMSERFSDEVNEEDRCRSRSAVDAGVSGGTNSPAAPSAQGESCQGVLIEGERLQALSGVAVEFVTYWLRDGGCGMCGGVPHSTTCFVGRVAALLASDGSPR